MANPTFENLPLPRKDLPQLPSARYRIYKDGESPVVVMAHTALEALEASGVKDARKIERERLDSTTVVGAKDWALMEAPLEAKDAAAKPEAAPAAAEQSPST